MAVVHFYEKPGCLTNAKQKKLLADAGHLLIVHDLLAEPWEKQREKLRAFFGSLPVAQWFNAQSPKVKSGIVAPDKLTEQEALDLLVEQPLLIRRPLLEIEGNYHVGFDPEQLNMIYGWALTANAGVKAETCSKPARNESCAP